MVRHRPQPADHGPPGRTTRVVLSTCHLERNPQNDETGDTVALHRPHHPVNDAAEH